MLQSLRQHASSWIVKILFAFLILSFGLWGINDIFMGERDPAVAEVASTKITFNQLNDAVRQETARLQPLFGGALDRDQVRQLGLIEQALDKLVDGAVFANATRDYGLTVDEEMIRRHILSERAFHDARGQFDRAIFRQVLMQNALTEDTYVAGLRRDLPTSQLIGAITASTPAPDILLESLHRFREEGRVADTVTVPANQSSTPPVPDDATIAEYYKAHIQRFMAPEMRSFSYVLIDPAALTGAAAVPDDRLKAEYDARINEFTVRERRDIDQAVLTDEHQVRRVAEFLDKGQSFADALKQANASAEVVKLGWVERADLLGEIAEPAFSLQAGQHSAPIKSPLGWHVLVVNRIEKGHVKPFDEVRDQLRKDITGHQAADEAHTLAIRLEDALAGGAKLEDAATQVGLKIVKLPPVDSSGLTAEGKPAPDLINDARFMRTAFDTPQGQESQLLEMPQNRFAVIYVDQITPPTARPLEQVKTDVIATWQQQERMDAARKRAEAIVERVNKGEALAAVAEAEKLELKTTPAFSRASHDSETGLPEALKAQLFDLKVGGAGAAEANDGYVVAALKEIKPAPALPQEARDSLASQISRTISDDLLDQLAVALRGRYNIEIRRDIIDSRF